MTEMSRPQDHILGLACWSGPVQPMTRPHRHDDIEVNVVLHGDLSYRFGSRLVNIPAGSTAIFWAALPHQLVGVDGSAEVRWLTIPLDMVLRWRLPDRLITRLLVGEPLLTDTNLASAVVLSDLTSTTQPTTAQDALEWFGQWAADLAAEDPELEQIALLEMEAFLRRITRVAHPASDAPSADQTSGTRSRTVAMATFIATHFRESIAVDDVADVVHLHPHYAMQVFRSAVGSTIGTYLTQCRLAEAQRLLIMTNLTVASVAAEAGFGSSGRLYAACADAGIPSPANYRRIHQAAAGWRS